MALFFVSVFVNLSNMSRAFIRESDDMSLQDIGPSMNALIMFLTRENNGIRVYEQRTIIDPAGREIHVMSNGLSYARDEKSVWQVVG